MLLFLSIINAYNLIIVTQCYKNIIMHYEYVYNAIWASKKVLYWTLIMTQSNRNKYISALRPLVIAFPFHPTTHSHSPQLTFLPCIFPVHIHLSKFPARGPGEGSKEPLIPFLNTSVLSWSSYLIHGVM